MNSFSSHNRDFYNRSNSGWLKHLAQTKGLESCADMEALTPHIVDSRRKKILEIGSGFGRVATWLINNTTHINYTGVDFSVTSINHCREKLDRNENCRFVLSDILDLSLNETFDYIIWPWSGFLEVSNLDKVKALSVLERHLQVGGSVFLDYPNIIVGDEKKVFRSVDIIEQHSDFGFACNQLIHDPLLQKIYSTAGLKLSEQIWYESEKGSKRYFTKLERCGLHANQ